ncbi:hypothetical protein D3C86_2239800 [compost metagenome]
MVADRIRAFVGRFDQFRRCRQILQGDRVGRVRGDKARAAKSYSHALGLDPKYLPAQQGLARTRGGGA